MLMRGPIMTKDLDEQLAKVNKQIYMATDGRLVIKKYSTNIGDLNGSTSK